MYVALSIPDNASDIADISGLRSPPSAMAESLLKMLARHNIVAAVVQHSLNGKRMTQLVVLFDALKLRLLDQLNFLHLHSSLPALNGAMRSL